MGRPRAARGQEEGARGSADARLDSENPHPRVTVTVTLSFCCLEQPRGRELQRQQEARPAGAHLVAAQDGPGLT